MTSSALRATVTFALAALCACAGRGGDAQAIPSGGSVAGTYRVVVCAGACAVTDTARALAWGTLVLGEGPIEPSLDAPEERTLAGFSRMSAGRDEPNACYALTSAARGESFAGIMPMGVTHWSDSAGVVSVNLYRSPDAGYEAELRRDGNVLRGRGRSWIAFNGFHQDTTDRVVAERTGPPDGSRCRLSPTAGAEVRRILGGGREIEEHGALQPAPAFASVSAGGNQACGVTADGEAWCWGGNLYGQLGDGSTVTRTAAVPVRGGHRFLKVSVGNESACGLRRDGVVLCWGRNEFGVLGRAHAPDRCGSSECSTVPRPVDGGLRFRDVSVGGGGHACAVDAAGAAWCWGSNWAGAVGRHTARFQRVPVAVDTELRFASVAAGTSFTCALTAQGVAYCWGVDREGSLGDGPTPADCRDAVGHPVPCRWAPAPVAGGLRFRAIAARGESACGITLDGHPWCWGQNVRDVPPDVDHHAPPTPAPVAVSPGRTFTAMVPPGWHSASCGLDAAGDAWCWGKPGELFLSPVMKTRPQPERVVRGMGFRQIALGNDHACALDAAGAAYCWGFNATGQLGIGRASDGEPPARVMARR